MFLDRCQYAIGNLVFELNIQRKRSAIARYVQEFNQYGDSPLDCDELLERGIPICTIIRAGSQYRQINKDRDNDEFFANLQRTFQLFDAFYQSDD